MDRRPLSRRRVRKTKGLGVLGLVAGVVLTLASTVTAASTPQQFPCPSGSPSGSTCYEFPPGTGAPSGTQPVACPSDAPSGSTCVMVVGQPASGGSPSGGSSGSSPSCSTSAGPVTLDNLWEMTAGSGTWVHPTDVCAWMQDQQTADPSGATIEWVAISLITAPGVPAAFRSPLASLATVASPQDLTNVAPAGTLFKLELHSSGASIWASAGEMDQPFAQLAGTTATIIGADVPVRFAANPGDCSTASNLVFFADALILGGSNQGVQAALIKGTWWGTNAQSIAPPTSTDGKTVKVTVSGCPQAPGTLEGFVKGFIPTAGADQLLGGSLVGNPNVPSAATSQLFSASNNGQPAVAQVAQVGGAGDGADPTPFSPGTGSQPAPTGGTPTGATGIAIDFHTSFSSHALTATANTANVALAKRCLTAGGRLSVSGRGDSSKLVCAGGKSKNAPAPKKKHRKHRSRPR